MDSFSPEQIPALIEALIAGSRSKTRQARQRLESAPRDLVIPALTQALADADSRRAFERITNLFARLGGEEAMKALANQARVQRRFSGLAMRALAKCEHPQVAPVLLELVHSGKRRQRRTASLALARSFPVQGIDQCVEAADKNPRVYGHLLEALCEVGRVDDLARMVLCQSDVSVADRVRAICGLQALRLSLFPFNPQRFLDREAANGRSPVRQEARAAADLLRQQTTLLRPSEHRDDTILLRAASSPGETDGETLLRAADRPEEEDDPHAPPSGWHRWWSRLRRTT